ncbi:MAG: RNA pyrophosphohydrolase [Pseudomonadota bacterium]
MTTHALPYRPCAGVMLVNAAGEVFVGQRKDSDVAAWQMPQGGIDAGELPRDAALRELEEETGLSSDLVTVVAETREWLRYDLPDHLLGKVWKGRYGGQEMKWILMRFHGSDSDVNIKTKHQEFSEWRWLSVEDVPKQIVSFKRDMYEKVIAEFGGLL